MLFDIKNNKQIFNEKLAYSCSKCHLMMNNKWFIAIHMAGVHGFIDKRSGNTDTTVYSIIELALFVKASLI